MRKDDDEGLLIGLEVHVQLNRLKTKLFCGCPADYQEAPPNSRVCEVCLGLPGALPNINRRAVEAGLKVAKALRCEMADRTLFYRKNYHYPDLPRGFQISQYDFPLAVKGRVLLDGDEGRREIRIRRVHMEEDPGRLLYPGGSIETAPYSLIDYNRSGVGLLEVVTEPDLRSPREARRFVQALRTVLEYLEVCDPDKEGAMRADANVSLAGGKRVEVKNIGSAKGVERALVFEIARQKGLLRRGQVIVQETRHYDEARGITTPLRGKETEEDYRYFPEPDLVPFRVKEWSGRVALPELPDAKAERFVREFGISEQHARVLAGELKLARLFEAVAKGVEPKLAAAWIADVLQGELNFRDEHYSTLQLFGIQPELLGSQLKGAKLKVREDIGLQFRPDLLWTDPQGYLHWFELELYSVDQDTIREVTRNAQLLRAKYPKEKIIVHIIGPFDPDPATRDMMAKQDIHFDRVSYIDLKPRRKYEPPSSPDMAEFLKLLAGGQISDQAGVVVLQRMLDEGGSPRGIVARLGLAKAAAPELEAAVEAALKENPKAAGDYKGGKPEALNFLVGQVLKRLKGRADAAEVRRLLQKRL